MMLGMEVTFQAAIDILCNFLMIIFVRYCFVINMVLEFHKYCVVTIRIMFVWKSR